MKLDKFTLLRNKLKRVVEQNTDGNLDEKENALRNEIIEELQNNPKGIVISTQQIIRFTTASIDNECDWFFELLLDDENESSVSELLKEDYINNDPQYYEQEGLEVKYDVTITDLEGNVL